ncbi:cytochrome ubiquinol oxidase subunit I [Asanoa sp. WMMD1127]|nr:cytochrome ubiquinol oxidase subunit I [Asanoa sp. WMMD1127]MDG4820750.1 cytochrome ubiquinol oxidase subunit I [Asanoa sp. WMMD1127]
MDTSEIARLQFALTAGFHFLFVALTLGLGPLVAILETRYAISKKPVFERLTKFWGHIYVINYAVGIFVGLVLEFQVGLNWSGLSKVMGGVFGVPLALETLIAFFLESTFLGMWIFGWGRMNRWLHVALFWLVVLTAYVSAFWILAANGFLQSPRGFELTEAGARLTSLSAIVLNSATILTFLHVLAAAMLTGGLFMAGVSAWHLFRRTTELEFFRRSMRLGVLFAVVGSLGSVGFGFGQMAYLTPNQPLKMAVANGRTEEALRYNAEMAAEHGPGNYLPPDWIATPYAVMQALGFVFVFFALICAVLLIKNLLDRWRFLLIPLMIAFPLPFVVNIFGWILREVGRQPWAVYDVLLVRDAVSPMGRGAMLASLSAFLVLFVVLVIVDWALIARVAVRGPNRSSFGRTLAEAEGEPPESWRPFALAGDERAAGPVRS